ncbi:PREDICTED: putative invertase inhibitor [Camelina sativa]|uniref:Invertase inhibitor n=1 Tax=Camelina sativa TaxID=90675 RepID=A0ABM0X6A2_CAMSA|nr:PREDICTED: putative invertase inhibitor [Camelina sativa]
MKFLIYFVVLFFLSNGYTANRVADSLIRDSCKKSSKSSKQSEPHYYNFCIASISENPESQKAKNIDELTMVGVKNAISNMTNVKGIVEKILKERNKKSKLSDKMLRECLKLYSQGHELLTKSLEYITLRDFDKVHNSLRNARVVPRECEMGFNDDNKQKSPVTKENDVLFDIVNIAQSFNYNAHINPYKV